MIKGISKYLVQADYKFRNNIIGLFCYLLFRPINKLYIHNILIFRTGSIGDNVCAIPAIKNIRNNFPDAKIDLLTNSGGKDLVGMPALMRTGIVNKFINYLDINKRKLFQELKRENYDLFIELPQTFATLNTNIRNMFIAKMIGVKYGIGWEVYATTFFKKNQEKENHFTNEKSRLLKLLKKYGLFVTDTKYELNITEEDYLYIDKILKLARIDNKERNIAMIIGAKRLQNRWPIDYFKQVGSYFSNTGFNIILVGGPEDVSLAHELKDMKNVFDYTGKLSPMQSAALLSRVRLAVCNDTGPMHLAYAVGTPVIALFSSRDYPEHWYPPADIESFVFRSNDIYCSICLSEICKNNICMQYIYPKAVISQAEKMLKKERI